MKRFNLLAICLFTMASFSQSINLEMDSDTQNPYLLGKIDKQGLSSEPYLSWFSKNYDSYKIDETALQTITPHLKNYDITLFLGTWCVDSKREVPRFYKILEACNFPMDQLTVVAVSNTPELYKQSPQHEEEGLDILRVPTFIFYKDGKEINRIVERPVASLEKDIQNIISAN